MKLDRIKEIKKKLIKENYKIFDFENYFELVKENKYKLFKVIYIKKLNQLTLIIKDTRTDMIISSKYYDLSKITDIDFIFLIDRIKMFYRLFDDLFV